MRMSTFYRLFARVCCDDIPVDFVSLHGEKTLKKARKMALKFFPELLYDIVEFDKNDQVMAMLFLWQIARQKEQKKNNAQKPLNRVDLCQRICYPKNC